MRVSFHHIGNIILRQEAKRLGYSPNFTIVDEDDARDLIQDSLEELGYTLNDEELKRAFTAFKELADKKKEVTDRDIESLIAQELRTVSEVYQLVCVQVSCGDRGIPTASVRLIGPEGQVLADASLGTGPVDAVYKAINRIVGVPNELTEFTVKSVTEGIDAIGEVLIRIASEGVTYTGRGADTDVIVASAKAYMNALNRLLQTSPRRGWERPRCLFRVGLYQSRIKQQGGEQCRTSLEKYRGE